MNRAVPRRVLSGLAAFALVAAGTLVAASPASAEITTDPVMISGPADVTNDQQPSFLWSAADGDDGPVRYDVGLYRGSTLIDQVIATLPGYRPTTPLSDGDYRFRVIPMDDGGYSGGNHGTGQFFTVDATPPAVTISTPALGAAASSPVTVSGSVVESGSGVQSIVVKVGASTLATQTSSASSFSFPLALASGAHTIDVLATDAAGNSGQQSVSFVVAAPLVVDAPAALAPAGYSTASGIPASWTPVANATGYEARLALAPASLDAATVASVPCAVVAGVCTSPGVASAEGTWYYQVRGVNADGVAGPWSATQTVVLDRTAPSAPSLSSPANGAKLTTADVTVSNTTATDAVGPVTYSYRWAQSATVDGSGVLSGGSATQEDGITTTSHSAHLADGVWWFQVSAVDAAGSRSAWSAVRSVTVDTGAPTVSFTAPAAGVVTTSNAAAAVSVDVADSQGLRRVVVKLEDSTGTVVKTLVPASTVVPGTVSTTVTANLPKSLTDGTSTIRAIATDLAGNVTEVTRTVVIDDTDPTLTISSPTAAQFVAGTLAVSAGASDANGLASFLVRIRTAAGSTVTTLASVSTPGASTAGTWNLDTTTLAAGDYVVRVRAEDVAGNAVVQDVAFTVDNTKPAVDILQPCPCALVNGDVDVEAQIDDAGGLDAIRIRLFDDSGNRIATIARITGLVGVYSDTESWTIPARTFPADGWYTIQVRAVDHAGNARVESVRIEVDLTDPATPVLTAPADGAALPGPTVDLAWDGIADAAFYDLRLSLSGTVNAHGRLSGPQAVTVPLVAITALTIPSVPDGTYWWQLRAVDAAGNQSSWSTPWSFTVDTTRPGAVTPTAPADGATVTVDPLLAWTSDPDAAEYEVRTAPSASVDTDGRLDAPSAAAAGTPAVTTLQLGSTADGTVWWQVRAVDAAGNAGPWSAPVSFVRQTSTSGGTGGTDGTGATGGPPGSGGTGGAGSPGGTGGTAATGGTAVAPEPLVTLPLPGDEEGGSGGSGTSGGSGSGSDGSGSTSAPAASEGDDAPADGGVVLIWIIAGVLALVLVGGGGAYLWWRRRPAGD